MIKFDKTYKMIYKKVNRYIYEGTKNIEGSEKY
jgi:hypothetical protein